MSQEQETHPLVRAVLAELRENPGFAELLLAALPAALLHPAKKSFSKQKAAAKGAAIGASTGKGTKKPSAVAPKEAKAAKEEPLNLTSIFNRNGESALRVFLQDQPKKQLQTIIKRQQIPVDAAALMGEVAALRNAVVEGVKFRIAERLAASS